MKKKLLSTIVGLAIVVSIGFGLNPMQKITPAFADTTNLSICTQITAPIPGSSQVSTYTVPQGFKGDPTTANGQCIVDQTHWSNSNPCTITNGIATAGHCEMIQKGYQIKQNGPATLPTEEWFHLAGVDLQPGQFLDLVDTTPFITTKGHMATVLPCDNLGQPKVRVFEGIIDGGVNTIEPANIQYLQQLSDPAHGICAYHFDIGTTSNNPDGVTDFAIVNIGSTPVSFSERNTSTFSVVEGYLNSMG